MCSIIVGIHSSWILILSRARIKVLFASGPGQFWAGDLPPARGPGPGQSQEASARVLPRRPQRRHRHVPAAAVQVSHLLSCHILSFSHSNLPDQGRLRGSRHYRCHGSGHALLSRDIPLRGHSPCPPRGHQWRRSWSQLRGPRRQASGRGLL